MFPVCELYSFFLAPVDSPFYLSDSWQKGPIFCSPADRIYIFPFSIHARFVCVLSKPSLFFLSFHTHNFHLHKDIGKSAKFFLFYFHDRGDCVVFFSPLHSVPFYLRFGIPYLNPSKNFPCQLSYHPQFFLGISYRELISSDRNTSYLNAESRL